MNTKITRTRTIEKLKKKKGGGGGAGERKEIVKHETKRKSSHCTGQCCPKCKTFCFTCFQHFLGDSFRWDWEKTQPSTPPVFIFGLC